MLSHERGYSQPAIRFVSPDSVTSPPPSSGERQEWYTLHLDDEPEGPPKHYRSSSSPKRGISYDSLLIPPFPPGDNKTTAAAAAATTAATTTTTSFESNSSSPRRQRRLTVWLWEVGACLLSLGSFAAIIVVLRAEDGKPLDEWSWENVGPTAVVSFISVIVKSSMLLAVSETMGQLKWFHFQSGRARSVVDLDTFDKATRGPLGAAGLIWRRNYRNVLASLAAVVIISSMFIDPFVQLAFAFPSHTRHDPAGHGIFKSSHVYDPSGHSQDTGSLGSMALDRKMQSAIVTAASGQTIMPTATCSTGNCTWPKTTMLGVCGSCSNVTSMVEVDCPPSKPPSSYQCRYKFPSGKIVWGEAGIIGRSRVLRSTRWNSTSAAIPILNSTILPADSLATLVRFDAVEIPVATGDLKPDDILHRPVAWQCALILCEKSYENITTTNGLIHLPAPHDEPLYVVGNATRSLNQPVAQIPSDSYFPLQTSSSASNSDATNSANSASEPKTFKIHDHDYFLVASYLSHFFSHSWVNGGAQESTRETAPVPNLGWEFSEAADLERTIRHIADSMTEVIRTGRNSTQIPAARALRTRTYIEVQWLWLTFPLAAVALSSLLMVVMVVRTALSEVPVWKNSSLALLVYRVPAWHPRGDALRGPRGLEREARGVSAMLSEDPENLVFVRT